MWGAKMFSSRYIAFGIPEREPTFFLLGNRDYRSCLAGVGRLAMAAERLNNGRRRTILGASTGYSTGPDTAVVLADETLLRARAQPPSTHAHTTNVTMGFPHEAHSGSGGNAQRGGSLQRRVRMVDGRSTVFLMRMLWEYRLSR